MAQFGADEAGKGPVLGSMFAACVAAPGTGALPDGVADSKALAPERREALAAAVRDDDRLSVGVREVPVERIDAPDTDMNGLAARAHAEAVAAAATEGDAGVVDAADTDPARFARRVADATPLSVSVTGEHRADENRPLVAAASVVAKVERDRHVESLAAEYGAVGSGYPSDPTTRDFLAGYVERHGRLPECARSSWATCEDVVAAAEQSALGEF